MGDGEKTRTHVINLGVILDLVCRSLSSAVAGSVR